MHVEVESGTISFYFLTSFVYIVFLSHELHILFSAAEGPDLLSEELNLLRNINMAVNEERYKDAGT